MRLILTHEQADLDALASLLSAHLLDPQSYALLPRQINRNGSAFLRRFTDQLGFTTFDQLPHQSVEHITLVDTQSLVTVRGTGANTSVSILDHHPRKAQINPNWQTEIHNTGACTTLLVEKIKDAQTSLNEAQATLMLLGIYEDTGSLTYSSTTPRDAKAVAYLLENGADLNLASRYLNPPLSNAQQQLFDRLLKDLTTLNIEKNTIIVAKTSALDLVDEISTIAHKMREFLTPEGLILLVATRQGIRLVGRSTTDNLDMARLARHFGGGGHKRASSALIRKEGKITSEEGLIWLEKTFQEVVDYLPKIVLPFLKVKQIMSQKPLLIDPTTDLCEVNELMKRYGYEGYPVVERGRLVGLLTRRNVDRAIQHKMKASAGDLMDAGEISVSPEDSVTFLQEVMAGSGWGQVPVVDPESSEIIGIVTRTDLIGTLNVANNIPEREEIITLLQNALSPEREGLLKLLAREASSEGVQAYIVGGFVRDLLINRPSQDFDVVVEGDAIRFVDHLVETYGGRAVTHKRFGTAKWFLDPHQDLLKSQILPQEEEKDLDLPDHLDLITSRTEFYDRPAALPVVERSSIKMDLHRRDFTINTLAVRLDGLYYGKLFDFWGGYNDLREGRIRVLHALSFVDDATRMLRAVRFTVRFDFAIEPRTLNLLEASLPLIDQISGPRLQHEFNLIFQEPKLLAMLDMLSDLGILKAIHPSLKWNEAISAKLQWTLNHLPQQTEIPSHKNGGLEQRQRLIYSLWLEENSQTELEGIGERLRLPTKLLHRIDQVRRLRSLLPELTHAKPSRVTELLDEMLSESIETVQLSTSDLQLLEVIQKYQQEYRHVSTQTRGSHLREMGLEPSPFYDELLSKLRAAWLDGEVKTAAQEKSLLRQLIQNR